MRVNISSLLTLLCLTTATPLVVGLVGASVTRSRLQYRERDHHLIHHAGGPSTPLLPHIHQGHTVVAVPAVSSSTESHPLQVYTQVLKDVLESNQFRIYLLVIDHQEAVRAFPNAIHFSKCESHTADHIGELHTQLVDDIDIDDDYYAESDSSDLAQSQLEGIVALARGLPWRLPLEQAQVADDDRDIDTDANVGIKVNTTNTGISSDLKYADVNDAADLVSIQIDPAKIIEQIRGLISQFGQNIDRGSAVRAIVDHFRTVYPHKNVMVVHSNYLASFQGQVKSHLELSQRFGTIGYDIFVFDSGVFTLLGDGGYINWGFGGQFKRDGSRVVFSAP